MKKPTIKDIARIVGVSTTTISRYLNDSFDQMSQDTKDRIQSVIDELEYMPSSMARNLKTHKSGIIGFVVMDAMKSFFPLIWKGMNDVCKENGYQLMVANSSNDRLHEKKHLKAMSEYNFEGIIVYHTGMNLDYLTDLKNDGVKIMLINQGMENRTIDSVTSNNKESVQSSVDNLFQKGYEDVYLVIDESVGNHINDEKCWGFRLCSQKHSFDYDSRVIVLGSDFSPENFRTICENSKRRKTAFICVSGITLLKTITVLRKMEIRIPEDIGILGFDDLEWSDTLLEGITVIKQPAYKIGSEAARLLIERISGKQKVNDASHLTLMNTLIDRGSTLDFKNQEQG